MHLPPADRNFLTCDAGHVAAEFEIQRRMRPRVVAAATAAIRESTPSLV